MRRAVLVLYLIDVLGGRSGATANILLEQFGGSSSALELDLFPLSAAGLFYATRDHNNKGPKPAWWRRLMSATHTTYLYLFSYNLVEMGEVKEMLESVDLVAVATVYFNVVGHSNTQRATGYPDTVFFCIVAVHKMLSSSVVCYSEKTVEKSTKEPRERKKRGEASTSKAKVSETPVYDPQIIKNVSGNLVTLSVNNGEYHEVIFVLYLPFETNLFC